MAMEVMNSYGSYAAQYMAGNSTAIGTKKKDTEQTTETANSSKSKSTADYMNELSKLVPSVECKIGNTFSSAKSGKTLTINPLLLDKMQKDPKKEKEMKELIRGVESAVNMLDSVMNASGCSVVFKHDYIDENGKYRQIALVRNDFMLNMSDKLREERRKNSEKLIEKTKEKAAEKKKESQDALEEKLTIKEDEKTTPDRVEQFLDEKITDSKDNTVLLNEEDIETIIEIAEDNNAEQTNVKNHMQVGSNLDLKI